MEKPVTAQCGENVSGNDTVPISVWRSGDMSCRLNVYGYCQVLCAKVAGATSSEGFLALPSVYCYTLNRVDDDDDDDDDEMAVMVYSCSFSAHHSD